MSATDVVIVDSGGANLASLRFALERLGAGSRLSADPEVIAAAPRVLLPGVGAAADAMARLRAAGLLARLRALTQPLLGICLGMQILYTHTDEGDTPGLDLVAGTVRRIPPARGRPVPHMGWNTCHPLHADALLAGIKADEYFYFVHSYACPVSAATSATTDYGLPMAAVVARGNFHGVQFHPERSGPAGARVLRNFLEL